MSYLGLDFGDGSVLPSSVSSATLISIAGIAVAGVLGPMATAWATRRANRQQFERDLASKRRADLRHLIDEAAQLLGAGAMNLRLAAEALSRGELEPPEVSEWATSVHLLKQRLLLRLPPEHVVMDRYEAVLGALEQISRTEGPERLRAVQAFEAARDSFLDNARDALAAPIET